jgi:hypothetical protein
VAFSATLPVVNSVLEALTLGNFLTTVAAGDSKFPSASDMLVKMARIMHGFTSVDVEGSHGHIGGRGPIMEMSSFLAKCGTMFSPS